jgi:hypothetical protein
MSQFWKFINQEPNIIKESYMGLRDVNDLAIHSWDNFITPVYFTDFKSKSSASLIYKTQTDIALKQAITSVLKKEYPQALYNIRFAVENIVIAIYGYAKPDEVFEVMKLRKSLNKKMRQRANRFLEDTLPERSIKFQNLHKTCNVYGAHQNIGHTGRNHRLKETGFEILIHGEDSPQMNVGLAGIIIGVILEFHFAISELEKVDWLKPATHTANTMQEILKSFDTMKFKYRGLWGSLLEDEE